MIFYATKQTMDRYKLKPPEQLDTETAVFAQAIAKRERGNRMFEWGCKLFYFDRRKCLQFMHFETKLVVFLVDLKMKDLKNSASAVANYLLDMYAEDAAMQQALENYFAASPLVCFDRITDRSIISGMNSVQSRWAIDGYYFYNYLQDGILHTRRINRDVNKTPQMRRVDGKEEWIFPYALFAQTIKEHFGG